MSLVFNREAIREARERAGMSRKDLANLLNCTRQQVYAWENGPHRPSLKTLERLWSVLNITDPASFFLGSN